MTVAERNNILSKEILSIQDFIQLGCENYQAAAKYIRDIKDILTIGRKKELRIDIQGKIHTQDYFDFVGVKTDRYNIQGEEGNGKQ